MVFISFQCNSFNRRSIWILFIFLSVPPSPAQTSFSEISRSFWNDVLQHPMSRSETPPGESELPHSHVRARLSVASLPNVSLPTCSKRSTADKLTATSSSLHHHNYINQPFKWSNQSHTSSNVLRSHWHHSKTVSQDEEWV